MDSFDLLEHIRGNDTASVIWLCNIGVEKFWGASQLTIKDPAEEAVVNHIEEIQLLLSRPQDYVILREQPDEDYLSYLQEVGFSLPTICCPAGQDEKKSIGELVLEDEALLQRLSRERTKKNLFFVPYGVSASEEKIAELLDLDLVGNSLEKSRILNNKIFSKQIIKELDLFHGSYVVAEGVEETATAIKSLLQGYDKVVVKAPCNASGKGIFVIDDSRSMKLALAVIRRNERMLSPGEKDQWLVEGWVDKKKDLNYQIYVSGRGKAEVFSIKGQRVDGTVYKGSVIPAGITESQRNECLRTGERVGKYLFEKGFSGVMGIDALIDRSDRLLPIIEVNGRFTLSTYLSFLRLRYPDTCIESVYFNLSSLRPVTFSTLLGLLKEDGICFDGSQGVFPYVSATINTDRFNGRSRVFFACIGSSAEDVAEYRDKTENLLEKLER